MKGKKMGFPEETTLKEIGLEQEYSQNSVDEIEELKTNIQNMDSQCKLILKLKTSPEGFWKLNESCSSATDLTSFFHDPPLVPTQSYYKKIKERQRNFNSSNSKQLDMVLQQSVNQLWDNKQDFEDEFQTTEKTKQLNEEIKGMVISKDELGY